MENLSRGRLSVTIWDLPFVYFFTREAKLEVAITAGTFLILIYTKIDLFRNISDCRNLFRDGRSPHCMSCYTPMRHLITHTRFSRSRHPWGSLTGLRVMCCFICVSQKISQVGGDLLLLQICCSLENTHTHSLPARAPIHERPDP